MRIKNKYPWIAKQKWQDVLFMHWPVSPKDLEPFINKPLNLDTFDNQAWISVVLFQAKNSHLRGMPTLFSYPSFLQLNIRTYVLFNNTPGVYFFSLDANSLPVVAGGRFFSIPYVMSEMKLKRTKKKLMFQSARCQQGYPSAQICANYKSLSSPYIPTKDSLDYWLVERYYFWLINNKKIYQAPISHKPWELQNVKTDVTMDDINPLLPTSNYLKKDPITSYSKSMQAFLHPFELKGLLG